MNTTSRITSKLFVLTLGFLAYHERAIAADQYTVHEWGTFTVLQDETGQPLPGVNVNEEALPRFVHRLSHNLLPDGGELAPFRGRYSKGIPSSYPAALMRMETPIIYIYPPAGKPTGPLDVGVRFRGGWISEWYPNASVDAPGFDPRHRSLGTMAPETVGSIQWNNLSWGGEQQPPRTDEHVWLAPRQIAAPILTSDAGQSERYLFYRGVANIEAPLRVVRDSKQDTLSIYGNLSQRDLADEPLQFRALWLADIRDGKVAFRELSPFTLTDQEQETASMPADFRPADYQADNMARLRASMQRALLNEGLFEDEAEAMLNTWKLSYFQSPGLRLFFTLPRAWTDEVLPLSISEPAEVVRVMIGRIELVTPVQRKLLGQLAKGPVSDASWLPVELERMPPQQRATAWSQLMEGKQSLVDFPIRVPGDYRTFLDLGRFRDALILNELEQRPTDALRQFVRNYRLSFQSSAAVEKPARPVAGG